MDLGWSKKSSCGRMDHGWVRYIKFSKDCFRFGLDISS